MVADLSAYNQPKPYAGRYSVAEILGLGDGVRLLNPKLQQTKGENPRWFIRPQVERPLPGGGVMRRTERIYLLAKTKKEAQAERIQILARLNRREVVLAAQVTLGELLDEYLRRHVRRVGVLRASTQAKYEAHIKNHIRPGLGSLPLGLINGARVEEWIDSKVKLSYATRLDLRNILTGVFTKAEEWGYWRERKNPAQGVSVGRMEVARPRRKLSVEETGKLLELLSADVRLICEVALSCALRISEVFGIQERDVDQVSGAVKIERRWWRGDVDVTKSGMSRRVVMLGLLLPRVLELLRGEPERFVFAVKTKTRRTLKNGEVRGGYKGAETRDSSDVLQHFLRPAAKKAGVYYKGFGFHALRVEAVTEYGGELSPWQLVRMVGHAGADMTQHYTLADLAEMDRATKRVQERRLGLKKAAASLPQVATDGGEGRAANG